MRFIFSQRYFRWKPFDTSLPEGRSMERHRRMLLAAFASVFAKLANLLVIFVTALLTMNYLGKERYGLWMVMSSIENMKEHCNE